MTSEGFCYPHPTGGYAIEGFVFTFKGSDGELAITPQHLLGPPVRPHSYNWIALKAALSGKGFHGERFQVEVVLLHGPASVLARLVTDIERLRSREGESLLFPSAQSVEFEQSCFQCRIARDPYSSTRLSMLCRCATPTWWNGELPPNRGARENRRFAGTLSVLIELDPESLEVVQSDVSDFLRWLDREASCDGNGNAFG